MVNAPDLSLRGPNGAVAISGRHFQFVQSADKTYKPIASVAAVTAQPLAALPPYGCGVPFTGSDRLAGWQCLQRKFIGAMPSSLSLRGGRRPTWQSRSTRPDHRKAIGESAAAFPRLPRRFAPRNDKSGNLHGRRNCFKICNCQWRSVSAATDAIGLCVFAGSLYELQVPAVFRLRILPPVRQRMRNRQNYGKFLCFFYYGVL